MKNLGRWWLVGAVAALLCSVLAGFTESRIFVIATNLFFMVVVGGSCVQAAWVLTRFARAYWRFGRGKASHGR